jgi:hypothetical protein
MYAIEKGTPRAGGSYSKEDGGREGCSLHTQLIQDSFLHGSAAQRSAQELPQVEAYSPSACSVRGGEELVLTGSNFLPDSKVVFIERGPGEYLWGKGGQAGRAWNCQLKNLWYYY